MNDFLSSPMVLSVENYSLRLALGGVLICVIVLLAAWSLRRLAEAVRYGVLFGGMIGLLALPALIAIATLTPNAADEEIVKIPVEMLPEFLDRPAPEAVAEAAAPSGIIFLTMMWLLGVMIGLIRLARGSWTHSRAIVCRPWSAPFWTPSRQAQLAKQLGLPAFPAVNVAPAAPMPMVAGLWRPVIVLPEATLGTWTPAQLEAILLHEAAHIARRDPWALLAQRLAIVLFWWCPLVHRLSRRLNELRENICDDYALEGPCDHISYAEILVQSAERLLSLKPVTSTLALLDSAQGGLEARITRLLEREKKPMTKLSWLGKTVGAAILVGACLLATGATAFSGGQPQTPKKIQIKILIDGKEVELRELNIGDLVDKAKKKADQAQAKPEWKVRHTEAQPKPDPRIEELVKQAEAIKPGSGAEIRRALQGMPKPGEPVKYRTILVDGKKVEKLPPPPGAAGKGIIVLRIQDGQLQLNEADLKKLLEHQKKDALKEADIMKLLELHLNLEKHLKPPVAGWVPDKPPQPPVPPTPKGKNKKELDLEFRFIDPIAKEAKKPAVNVPAPDTEALRRQLERLTAELQELRRRLDADKAK
jgi:beta-lactamase regulating signal transducer with metallopeptidase domain